LASRALLITDEGNNGLAVHAVNDGPDPADGQVRLTLYRDSEHPVLSGTRAVHVPARGSVQLWAEGLLERFADVGYAFRFGPPGHDLVVAAWLDAQGKALAAPAFHFPLGRPSRIDPALELDVESTLMDGHWALRLKSRRFAQAVSLHVHGFTPSDDFFHLEPGVAQTVTLRSLEPTTGEPHGAAQPLNAAAATRFGRRS
jgi:beta-mannosidase